MAKITPPLGTVGRYELQQPWIAQSSKVYTCKAVRSFQDLRLKNINPYEYAYKPYGATEAQASADEAAGAFIVTIVADDGEAVYVPDTRIVSYPNMGDYHYRRLVISVDLGAVPDNLSLEWLMAKIAEETSGIVGINPVVRLNETEMRDVVTPEEHQRLEAARQYNLVNQTTTKAKLVIAENELADLTQKYRELEKYVTQQDLLPPTTPPAP